jgi:excisionase family DNA binding protein
LLSLFFCTVTPDWGGGFLFLCGGFENLTQPKKLTMNNELITFEKLPEAVSYLIGKVEALERTLQTKNEQTITPMTQWLNIDELREYLPDHPAKATIYGWVSSRQIPYHKGGKKLRFLQSEIDEWLATGKRKSESELTAEAEKYCQTKKITKR